MENKHLTYFKVENFKKFDALEVKDIGQFNLIVGDNNVGKTCLLEALLFDENPVQLLNNFYIGLTKRGLKFQIEKITTEVNGISTTQTIVPKENYFKKYIFKSEKENLIFYSNLNEKLVVYFPTFEILREDTNKLTFRDNNTNLDFISTDKIDEFVNRYIAVGDFFLDIYIYHLNGLDFPLISFNDTPLEEEAFNIYEGLKTKREKQILIDVLKVVSPKIVDVETRKKFNDLKSVFLISFEDSDDFVPLNHLGDGFKRIFYIALKALSLKGKRILIDEVEIGIHHSKMKDFWVNIMKVCNELEIQLFATTHSEECSKAFLIASKEINLEENIRLIKLEESTNKEKVYVSTFKHMQIQAGFDSNVDLRG